jgi:hypothetical protein
MSLMSFFCGLFSPLCRCEEPGIEQRTRTSASGAATDAQPNAPEPPPSPPSEETEIPSPS